MRKKSLRLFCILFFVQVHFSCTKVDTNSETQQPSDGLQFGLIETPSAAYASVPNAPAPLPGGVLPASFFLERPAISFNQSIQGSCVGSSVAMAKSIMDHTKLNIPYPNNQIIYSPAFLYNQTKQNLYDCKGGSDTKINLEVLKSKGVCKEVEMKYDPLDCQTLPTVAQQNAAASHKIDHYFKIDPINTYWMKEFIHAGLPIIVGFQVDNIFANSTQNDVWKSFGSFRGKHCALLYGWDDSKNAFKMLNSWGNSWKDAGSGWVDYDFIEHGWSWGKVFFEAYIIQNPPPSSINTIEVTGNLSFGNIPVNTSTTKTLQLKNTGTSNINISSISALSPFSTNWSSGIIQPGATQPVTITFSPVSVGNINSSVTINSNASNHVINVAATGSGIQPTSQTKIISLSGDLSFGNVTVGQSSSKTLIITNSGNSTLNVTSISYTSQGFSGNWSGPISAGGSVNVPVQFTPTNVQSYSGNLTVNSNATSGTNTKTISGNGVQNGGGNPTAVPPIGNYGNCAANGSVFCPPSTTYSEGTINARIVSINKALHQIIVEIKKCNGTAFSSGGNFNVVSGLCSGVSYGFGSFQSGFNNVQMTITDNNMTGTKVYYPFIIQGPTLNILYSAPPITVTY